MSYLNLKAQPLPVCLQSVLFTCNDATNVSAFKGQCVESTFSLVSVVWGHRKGFTLSQFYTSSGLCEIVFCTKAITDIYIRLTAVEKLFVPSCTTSIKTTDGAKRLISPTDFVSVCYFCFSQGFCDVPHTQPGVAWPLASTSWEVVLESCEPSTFY